MLKARFYLARAAEQEGDTAKALGLLEGMRKDASDPATVARLDRDIARLGGTAAVPEGGEAIAALPPAERQQQIHAMVRGLDERLTASGGGAQEWSRLVRAYVVLQEQDKARAALQRARAALAGNDAALQELNAAVAALGIADKRDDRQP
jgi:cytochrome c-type biogenesis protein CcmH